MRGKGDYHMTYNEFMKLFNEYKICRIKLALQNYNSDAEAALLFAWLLQFQKRYVSFRIYTLMRLETMFLCVI